MRADKTRPDPRNRPPERAKIDPSRLDSRSERPVRPTKSTQERSNGFFDRLFRPKWLEKGAGEGFWSHLGRFWLPWGVDFAVFSLLLRTSMPTRSKTTRCLKNLVKCRRVASKSRFCVCAHASKVDRISFKTRFLTELRDSSLSKGAFFEHPTFEVVFRGLSGVSLGALGRLLRRHWAPLGRSWDALGRSWSALAVLLGSLGALLGTLLTLLGRSWSLLAPTLAILA